MRECARSWSGCARAAGSAVPATLARCRWWTPAPRSAGPMARELPVIVSPLVDARFGPTAALGIPAVDEADATSPRGWSGLRRRRGRGGARARARRRARETKRYRANDFSISRQRSWGTPIPIIHCEQCGPVPVPEEDLPVVLPRDIKPTGEGNPLAERPDFVDVECPKCGGAGQARDRHARLPLRRALALGAGGGAARGPRRADVHPPRPAASGCRPSGSSPATTAAASSSTSGS